MTFVISAKSRQDFSGFIAVPRTTVESDAGAFRPGGVAARLRARRRR